MVRRAEPLCKQLKRKLEQAEAGDITSSKQIDHAEASEPETTEAVEQEAADGPPGRGLSI